jgi:two-component system response regulator RegX3
MPENTRRLLIVDDEPAILRGLEDTFRIQGYDVATAADGETALDAAEGGGYHAILLDLMLPGIDGFEVCRRLRAAGDRVPVLMLTARGAEEDKIEGLEIGADDYVTKPFGVGELVARVDALIRRAALPAENGAERITFGDLDIDLKRHEGTRGGEAFQLTPREVEILRYLDRHRDRVVGRGELLTEVWGYPTGAIETRTVDIHMAKLRKKVEDDATRPRLLLTVRGEGYMLGKEA